MRDGQAKKAEASWETMVWKLWETASPTRMEFEARANAPREYDLLDPRCPFEWVFLTQLFLPPNWSEDRCHADDWDFERLSAEKPASLR